MQEVQTNTNTRPVAQWTESEREILRALAPTNVRRATLAELFPDRSYSAAKTALSKERKHMGINRAPHLERVMHDYRIMLDPKDPGLRCAYPERWAAQAANSNAQFLAALRA